MSNDTDTSSETSGEHCPICHTSDDQPYNPAGQSAEADTIAAEHNDHGSSGCPQCNSSNDTSGQDEAAE